MKIVLNILFVSRFNLVNKKCKHVFAFIFPCFKKYMVYDWFIFYIRFSVNFFLVKKKKKKKK